MDDHVAHVGAKRKRVETALPEAASLEVTTPRHKAFLDGSRRDRSADTRPSRPTAAGAGSTFDGDKPILDVSKYLRDGGNLSKKVTDKKLKASLKRKETQNRGAATAAAHAELLNTAEAGFLEAEGMEKTYRFKQGDITAAADILVAKKSTNLALETYGPYHLRYSRNGRHMLLGGEKGHVAVIDWNTVKLTAEFHVRETVHDVSFLHNQTMMAVAQKKYAYIYDNTGMEIHCLRNHIQPLALEFLPYHFLLASVGNSGFLKYQDVSTGALVAEHRTKLGSCSLLRQNPWNAVLCCGHNNGTVTMWTPNMSTPVAKMLVHRGPTTALAVDSTGKYLVSAGMDSRVKVWDIRKFSDEPVFNYFTPLPAHSIDVSQRGLVAVGFGSHVQVWGREFGLEMSSTPITSSVTLPQTVSTSHVKFTEEPIEETDEADFDADGHMMFKRGKRPSLAPPKGVTKASAPYLRHEMPGNPIDCLRFRPFDDVLAIGHSMGVSSIIVPGAGEPNYDSMEADPFQAQKARKEAEVHGLLDKLAPATITLDPTDIGKVDRAPAAVLEKERSEELSGDNKAGKSKKKTRGRSKSERKKLKKTANVITAQRVALLEKRATEKQAAQEKAEAAKAAKEGTEHDHKASALSRFYK